jgi:hypothetical protein
MFPVWNQCYRYLFINIHPRAPSVENLLRFFAGIFAGFAWNFYLHNSYVAVGGRCACFLQHDMFYGQRLNERKREKGKAIAQPVIVEGRKSKVKSQKSKVKGQTS